MTRQYTVRGLLELTSLVAITITLAPVLLYKASFELIWVLAVVLMLCAASCDLILERPKSFIRTLISLLLFVMTLCMTWQWIRYDPRWGFLRFFVLLCTLLAVPRCFRIKLRRGTVLLSSIGAVAVVMAILWQLWETRSAIYFVNRQSDWGVAGVVETSDGKLALQGGGVSFYLSSPFRRSKMGVISEIETLINSVDTDEYRKPVTKFRVFCTADSIESLSIVDHATNQDWKHLPQLSQLRYLDFNRLTIDRENNLALRRLTSLQQIAFFNCNLPEDLLGSTQNCKNLWTLQIVGCTASSLTGLCGNSNIRTLILRGTRLTLDDLQEISKLFFLIDVDFRETGLSDEGQTYLAEQLVRHAASRRGQFACKIDYNGGSTDGLVQLAKSGSVGTLEVYCDQYGKTQLADLAATSPNIKLLPQEDGGTKP